MTNKSKIPNEHLLQDQLVVDEIRRHLWIESEKVGHDIGFDAAARDWLERFSQEWILQYRPESAKSKAPAKRSAKTLKIDEKSSKVAKKAPAKKRAVAKA